MLDVIFHAGAVPFGYVCEPTMEREYLGDCMDQRWLPQEPKQPCERKRNGEWRYTLLSHDSLLFSLDRLPKSRVEYSLVYTDDFYLENNNSFVLNITMDIGF